MDDRKPGVQGGKGQNEGEGNKSADKKYRDAASGYAKAHDTLKEGLKAEREVEESPGEYAEAEGRGADHGEPDTRDDLLGNVKKEP